MQVMRNCDANLIHRYHDGELTDAEALAVEAHLRDCEFCQQLLADLRRLSRRIETAAVTAEDVPPSWAAAVMSRHRRGLLYRSLVRTSGWMTAAAAVLLLTLWIGSERTPSPAPSAGELASTATLASWEVAAVAPPTRRAALADVSAGAEVAMATQWMIVGLSGGESQ